MESRGPREKAAAKGTDTRLARRSDTATIAYAREQVREESAVVDLWGAESPADLDAQVASIYSSVCRRDDITENPGIGHWVSDRICWEANTFHSSKEA